MTTPRLEIDLAKIAHNAKKLKSLYTSKGIGVFGVTKAVCADLEIVACLQESGLNTFADSRIENIQKMRQSGIQAKFILLRTPIPSQVDSVVKYADISLNSELDVIKELAQSAIKHNVIHKIILMVELGDLREGLMPSELENTVKEVLALSGVELVGIGTNLACLGGIKPDEHKMNDLSSLAEKIEKKFKIVLKYVSGGNSANYNWFMSAKDVGKVNNLRLGESILLGCETLNRNPIPELFTDAFTLVTEVIESKIKPSLPYGTVCQDAFGKAPVFADRGNMRRVILGVGRQDVLVSGLTPKLDIDILGTTSDHIIIDAKHNNLKVGNEIEFNINYGALLSAMTSPYILKKYHKKL
jgi:ornithine racemase